MIQTREQVEALAEEIVSCNPGADRDELMQYADFDEGGNLESW